ncbi:heme-binding protein [Ectothiorhodospiraceae bacterium WFHF3C12]|nr:heme-binding protein [Ectothiorhodospiraceae bacterium WFHF3C12]
MAGMQIYPAAVTLSLASARAVIEGAFAEARACEAMPLALVVIDGGGHLVAMERQDGAGHFRADVAMAKAWGALGFGVPSGVLGERLTGREAFQSALSAASGGRFAAVAGGVLILDESGSSIGAVGISGDVSGTDEACAVAGIEAAGMRAAAIAPD